MTCLVTTFISAFGAPRIKRPDWSKVYEGCAHTPNRDQELIPVTRETLRLAYSAIMEGQKRDAYDNYAAALREIDQALK